MPEREALALKRAFQSPVHSSNKTGRGNAILAGPPAAADHWEMEAQAAEHRLGRGSADRHTPNPAENPIARYSLGAEDAALSPLLGNGRPLPMESRQLLERRMGHDFSQVRIHADESSVDLARAFATTAFTLGRHIVFSRGAYLPGSGSGHALLAHELVHVAQQGGAPARQAAGHTPKIRGNGVTRLQAKGPAGAAWRVDLRNVARLIRDRDASLFALIKDNPMDGTPTLAKEAVAGAERHNWLIDVTYNPALKDKGDTREDPVFREPGRRASRIVHHIHIEFNPSRWEDDPELAMKMTDPKARREFLVAETLFHELVHAAIFIHKDFPAAVAPLQQVKDFNSMLALANSVAYKGPVMSALFTLISLAGAFSGDTTKQLGFANQQFERLINEKFSAQTAATAFGRLRGNDELAERYCLRVSEVILNHGDYPSDRAVWGRQIGTLTAAVGQLFDRIDIPELGTPRPGYFSLPPVTPAGPSPIAPSSPRQHDIDRLFRGVQ